MNNRRANRAQGATTYIHTITRVCGGERLLDGPTREALRRGMRAAAEFCGVEILTFCLLSNHLHILLELRCSNEARAGLDDAEIVRRYRALYPRPGAYRLSAEAVESRLSAGGEEAEELRGRLKRRMYDVSFFMKLLKQRFTLWYNKEHGRFGTVWAERFKSVLVEGPAGAGMTGRRPLNALAVCAAYIDLNPVRAGLVSDPKDYRFCGYGEAEAGRVDARRGIHEIMKFHLGSGAGEKAALRAYRSLLFGKGSTPARGKAGRGGVIDQDKAAQVIAAGGKLPLHVILRLRIRSFSEGIALGSKAFIEEVLEENRRRLGASRRAGAQPLDGGEWGGISVLRSLRKGSIGPGRKE